MSGGTIFDPTTRDELIARIHTLHENSRAAWGTMNVNEMLGHGVLFERMVLGYDTYPRSFLGKLFGRLALRRILKDDTPLDRNIPAGKEMTVSGQPDFEAEMARWISHLREYASFSNRAFSHPFFGPMSVEEIGVLVYKHTDHHLRQFGS